jgi:hypothetical protein
LHFAEKKYFVFALKYSGREVVEGSSNLVGYYLVESGSGSIYEWDLGQGKRIGQVLGLETKRMTWKGS